MTNLQDLRVGFEFDVIFLNTDEEEVLADFWVYVESKKPNTPRYYINNLNGLDSLLGLDSTDIEDSDDAFLIPLADITTFLADRDQLKKEILKLLAKDEDIETILGAQLPSQPTVTFVIVDDPLNN